MKGIWLFKVKEKGDIGVGCPVFKCNAILVGQVISPCCTEAVKVISVFAGLAKTGYVITTKFDLTWLVNINHCDRVHFYGCPFNCRCRRAG